MRQKAGWIGKPSLVWNWPIAKFFCNATLVANRGQADIQQAAFHSIWLERPTRSRRPHQRYQHVVPITRAGRDASCKLCEVAIAAVICPTCQMRERERV